MDSNLAKGNVLVILSVPSHYSVIQEQSFLICFCISVLVAKFLDSLYLLLSTFGAITFLQFLRYNIMVIKLLSVPFCYKISRLDGDGGLTSDWRWCVIGVKVRVSVKVRVRSMLMSSQGTSLSLVTVWSSVCRVRSLNTTSREIRKGSSSEVDGKSGVVLFQSMVKGFGKTEAVS